MRKLLDIDLKIINLEYFIGTVRCCSIEDIFDCLQGEIKLSTLKAKVIKERAKKEGITHGKPFETMCSNDLDWLRLTTKELDIYRWRNKICLYCGLALNTEHLKTCIGTKTVREEIERITGIEAIKLMDDPSLLNPRPDTQRKKMKMLVAGRISKMVHSAKSRGTL